MAVSDEKGPGSSSSQNAEASAGRIGDDVQRAKENIPTPPPLRATTSPLIYTS